MTTACTTSSSQRYVTLHFINFLCVCFFYKDTGINLDVIFAE